LSIFHLLGDIAIEGHKAEYAKSLGLPSSCSNLLQAARRSPPRHMAWTCS